MIAVLKASSHASTKRALLMLVGNAVSMLGAATRVCTKGGKGKKNKGVGAGEVPKAESASLKREK